MTGVSLALHASLRPRSGRPLSEAPPWSKATPSALRPLQTGIIALRRGDRVYGGETRRMTIAGIPLVERLPPPKGAKLLLLGGDDYVARELQKAGYQVDRHALDTGPLAQVAEYRSSFVPPVVNWPYPDASYDAVVLLDELALTLPEEEALAEAARVLRPGGMLLLRVPADGRLAWLDGYNAYRYIQEITHRGRHLRNRRGLVGGVTIGVRTWGSFSSRTSGCARCAHPGSDCLTARDWRCPSSGVGRCNRGAVMRPFVASRTRWRGWRVAWRSLAAATGSSPLPSTYRTE